ncbi:MAG: hypothetical protein AAFQ89_09880 [Cyanobacteria bacterium J06626_18]
MDNLSSVLSGVPMSWIQAFQRCGLVLVVLGSGAIAPRAVADEFPPCAPPINSEYLLLVKGDTVESRDRIQNLLPTTTEVTVCSYLNDIVVRAGGFTSLENANAWAQYLTEVEGAQAFVARPAAPGETATDEPITAEPVEPITAEPVEPITAEPVEPIAAEPVEPIAAEPVESIPELPSENPAETPTNPETPTATPVSNPETEVMEAAVDYAPQLLGEGYAVLVDYGNNPAVAKQLQQTLNQPVGLAVYEQQPFLLAGQSTDPQAAAQILQTLSTGRYGAFIVDSSDVVLISPGVATP